MKLQELRQANIERNTSAFGPLDQWSPTDWACAMAGECGEACNMVKKLRRLDHPDSLWKKTQNNTDAEYIKNEISKEVADLVIYADLLMARIGRPLDEAIKNKFNEVSERIGSPVKL